MRLRAHVAFRKWQRAVDDVRSQETVASTRMEQAVKRLQGSARCITQRVASNAFTYWHRKTRHAAQVSAQLLRLTRRLDRFTSKRRLRCALQIWQECVVAWRADRERQRALAYEHTLSRLALERRFFNTFVRRDRVRELFSRWFRWVLKRKNTRITEQLRKLEEKHRQGQKAEQHRMLDAAMKIMCSNLHHSASSTLAQAFRRWQMLAANIAYQEHRGVMHTQRCRDRLRSIILRHRKATKAAAWLLWSSYCRRCAASQERRRRDRQVAALTEQSHLQNKAARHTLVAVHMRRCCAAWSRVQTYWLTVAFRRWMLMAREAQNSKFVWIIRTP